MTLYTSGGYKRVPHYERSGPLKWRSSDSSIGWSIGSVGRCSGGVSSPGTGGPFPYLIRTPTRTEKRGPARDPSLTETRVSLFHRRPGGVSQSRIVQTPLPRPCDSPTFP